MSLGEVGLQRFYHTTETNFSSNEKIEAYFTYFSLTVRINVFMTFLQ